MVLSRPTTNEEPVYSLNFHLLWCTKDNRPVLAKVVAKRLRELLAGKAQELQVSILALDIKPDSVHLFIETSPRWSISLLIRQFKGYTSRTLRGEFPALKSDFPALWSISYFAGSCGAGTEVAMRRYIEEQKGSYTD